MKILALDTGGAQACVAAIDFDGDLQMTRGAARAVPQSRQVSREIIRLFDAVLSEAAWTLDDVEAIAAGLGPGSWTGLRIGLTTAKTLAQARELPLIGVPTFDALVHAATLAAPPVCDYCLCYAVAPCRAGEIYDKSWEVRGGQLHWHSAERIATLQEVADEIIAASPPWLSLIFAPEGQSAAMQLDAATPHLGTTVSEIAPEALARSLAILAAQRLLNHEQNGDDPLTLAPLYLAPSNAERTLAEKLARQNA